jgi:hypothetical protein
MECPGRIVGIKYQLVKIPGSFSGDGKMLEKGIPCPVRPIVGRLLDFVLPVVQLKPDGLCSAARFKYHSYADRSAGLHVNQKSE